MTGISAADDAAAAQWLLDPHVGWQDLVRYGPPGFDAHLRIALAGAGGAAADGEAPAMRRALATLGAHTATPTYAYAAIWEGWTSTAPAPRAPRIAVANRPMLLFAGPLELMRDAPSLAWFGTVRGLAEPHLVWPADRAWCVACDVDEEVEFSVGCSADAARALAAALPGAVRHVRYGESSPLQRDD